MSYKMQHGDNPDCHCDACNEARGFESFLKSMGAEVTHVRKMETWCEASIEKLTDGTTQFTECTDSQCFACYGDRTL